MKIKQTMLSLAVVLGIVGTAVFVPTIVQAANCGGVETSIISCPQTNDPAKGVQGNGTWGILLIVVNILTAGVGIAAVGGLIYAGIIYATASNDQAKIVKSKETIFNVVLGIIMYALMWSFAQYLIPGGIFK